MGLRIVLVIAFGAAMAACQRSESPPAAAPTPLATVLPSAARSADPASAAVPSSPAASPAAASSAGDDNDDEDEIDKPWGEFEIDADADRYYWFPPVTIMFAAHPLNGTPPVTYTWDMGDGSPLLKGDVITHIYDKVGQFLPWVEGTDAEGKKYRVSFVIAIVNREQYATRKGLDPAALPVQSPIPTTTP